MTDKHNRFYIPVEQRREFLEHDITLNGVRATISGINNPFATVRQLPDGLSAEFAWATVEHVIANNDGAFNA